MSYTKKGCDIALTGHDGQMPSAKDGDVVLRGGAGPTPEYGGNIRLQLPNGDEFMRIESTGKVFVRGNEVTGDLEAYQAFRAWLEESEIVHTKSTVKGVGDHVAVSPKGDV